MKFHRKMKEFVGLGAGEVVYMIRIDSATGGPGRWQPALGSGSWQLAPGPGSQQLAAGPGSWSKLSWLSSPG